MSEPQPERVDDLSGGRNSNSSELLVKNNQSPDDLNLIAKTRGAVERRPGFERLFGAAVTTHPVLGAGTFYKSDGNHWIVFGSGPDLWAHNLTTAETSRIDTGFISCQPWSFQTFQDWVYCTNFADIMVRWDGTNIRNVGLTVPVMSGAAAAAGADGFLSASTYYYRMTADYGARGESNLSSESLTVVAGANNHVTIPDQSANLPTDAEGFVLYRTLQNPPANTNLRVYYRVGTFTASYTDLKADDELLTEYVGDRPMPYNAAFLAKHVNRMWGGNLMERLGTAAYNSRVQYSALYQPDILGDGLDDPGFIDVYPNDGDIVTGIRPLNGNLVVFKRHKIYQILGTSLLDFEVRDTHADVGCIAPQSIAEVGNKLFFLSEKGVHFFNGQGTLRVSDAIDSDLRFLSPEARLWAFGGSFRNRYYLSVSSNG